MPGFPIVGTHYPDPSVAEDVSQIIYQISPTSKPLFNLAGQNKVATGVLHEWQRRELTTYQDNAAPEGFVYNFTAPQRLPVRLHNVNQIFEKEIRVSNTQQAILHHAINNPFGDQMQTKMVEIATDFEQAIMAGSLGTGETTQARRMDGIVHTVFGAGTTYTTYAGGTLSEARFNDSIEYLWDIGAEGRDCLVGGRLKRQISQFTSSNTHFVKADERKVVNSIGLYESDFFPVRIHLSRTIPKTAQESNGTNQTGFGLLLVDQTMLDVAWLRRARSKRIPETADSMDGVIVSEWTLESGHPNGHMFVANLNELLT